MKLFITLMLLFCLGTNGGFAQTLNTESDGFQWYELSGDNEVKGAQGKDGNILIPLSRAYTFICYQPGRGASPDGYFIVDVDHLTKRGACDINGHEIIPPKYKSVCRHGGDGEPYYFTIEDEAGKEGVCDMYGKVIIPPKYKRVYRHGGDGEPYYFSIKDGSGKEGVCDMSSKEIFPTAFESIIYVRGCFKFKKTSVGSSDTIKIELKTQKNIC